jgi:hypothetical protein
MDLQNLAIAIVVLALVELALDVSKKTPLWLSRQSVASFQRMVRRSTCRVTAPVRFGGVCVALDSGDPITNS